MYLAELHGKLSGANENREDILTSNVFSFFKYTDREVFLYPLLKNFASDIMPEDAQDAEFVFWPQYEDGTEPDLVLIAGRYYFLIEAKYHSGFGQASETVQHQLIREVQNGRYQAHNLDKVFKLVAVSSHYVLSPDLYKEVPPDALDDFIWISWGRIALLLEKILESDPPLSPETRLFANDLHALLLRKNLRMYAGQQFLFTYPFIQSIDEILFFDAQTAEYRGDFFGFLNTLKSQPKVDQFSEPIFYSYTRSLSRNHATNVESGKQARQPRKLFESIENETTGFPDLDEIFFKEGKHGQN